MIPVIVSTIAIVLGFFGLKSEIFWLWKRIWGKVALVLIIFLYLGLNTYSIVSSSSENADNVKAINDTTKNEAEKVKKAVDSGFAKFKNPYAADLGVLKPNGKILKHNPFLIKGDMEGELTFKIYITNFGKGIAYNISTSYAIVATDDTSVEVQVCKKVDDFSREKFEPNETKHFIYPLRVMTKKVIHGVNYYFCYLIRYQDDLHKDSLFAIYNLAYGKTDADMTSPNTQDINRIYNSIVQSHCFPLEN